METEVNLESRLKQIIKRVSPVLGPTSCNWESFPRSRCFAAFRRRPDLAVFALIIFIANAPVLVGSTWAGLMFHPDAIRQGQWWRLLTHPFVHLTWYHLLLDGSAFFILYQSLLEASLFRRVAYVVSAAAGSLLFCWLSPNATDGLCGLSGIAHGLMAVSALELVATASVNSPTYRVGLLTFLFVVAKAAYEAFSGHMFFAFLNFGLLGHPVSVSHAGGVIGALGMLLFIHTSARAKDRRAPRAKLGPDRQLRSLPLASPPRRQT